MSDSRQQAKTYKSIEIQSKINTASPHQLINLLFEGLLEKLHFAHESALRAETSSMNAAITSAIDIVAELHSSLSTQVESDLPYNLARLYEYIQRQLLRARISNSLQILEEITALVEPIADGWQAIGSDR